MDDYENPFPEPVELEITDSIDLHSFSPKDIKAVVQIYLEEARKKGFRIVRIIHGKGIGVQREMVRKVLSETDFVKSFKSGDEFSGGRGRYGREIYRIGHAGTRREFDALFNKPIAIFPR